jgi:plasmid maintenance system antidote protein VapI
VTKFADMLECDRKRMGLTVGRAAHRFGVPPSEYREIEAGSRYSSFDTYDRICRLFGWGQSFR